jgi:hypothetical protein
MKAIAANYCTHAKNGENMSLVHMLCNAKSQCTANAAAHKDCIYLTHHKQRSTEEDPGGYFFPQERFWLGESD